MQARAVVLESPYQVALRDLHLDAPGDEDLVVDVEWSAISTGTERLLWSGRMPAFPGMGYPLVPGYETVGRVAREARGSELRVGDRVFVPGARCFGSVRGLFGGSASRLVVPAARVLAIDPALEERGVLLALAATAHHALGAPDSPSAPELIVGHGVLGRMIARLARTRGVDPVVWETDSARRCGAQGYRVIDPAEDTRRDYRIVCDVSGDAGLVDSLIARLSPGGELVLAGFYDQPIQFDFPPAFMREARIRIAAQWQPQDLVAVRDLVDSGRLSLDGLITHCSPAREADSAYSTAFEDPSCLKMALDWRDRT